MNDLFKEFEECAIEKIDAARKEAVRKWEIAQIVANVAAGFKGKAINVKIKKAIEAELPGMAVSYDKDTYLTGGNYSFKLQIWGRDIQWGECVYLHFTSYENLIEAATKFSPAERLIDLSRQEANLKEFFNLHVQIWQAKEKMAKMGAFWLVKDCLPSDYKLEIAEEKAALDK